MHSKTRRIAEYSIFTAVALLFGYVESLFPLPLPFPGMKLGLANIVILVILYRRGPAAALGIAIIRNLLNALTFGNLFGLFYSLAGNLLSLPVMILLSRKTCQGLWRVSRRMARNGAKKHPRLSLAGISAVGGIIHNMGQCSVAICLVGYSAILNYLPFLYFAGLVAGILTGILATLCLQRLPHPGSQQ